MTDPSPQNIEMGSGSVEPPAKKKCQVPDALLPRTAKKTVRKNVDQTGAEVPDSKRSRAPQNKVQKMDALVCIAHQHRYLFHHFGHQDFTHIDYTADVTAVIKTCHDHFRQVANGVGALREKITEQTDLTVGQKTVKFQVIKEGLIAICLAYGFSYDKTEAARSSIGTLSSFLGLIVAYRARFNEVRLECHTVIRRKTENTTEVMNIAQFGLDSSHSTLLTGCTYPPMTQSSLKSCLGPMTIALMLCMQTEVKFQKSWVSAFTNCFKLVKNVGMIALQLAGSRTEKTPLLRALAEAALCGITRSSNKVFFPASALLHVVGKDPRWDNHFRADPATVKKYGFGDQNPLLVNMDFSGHGAYAV